MKLIKKSEINKELVKIRRTTLLDRIAQDFFGECKIPNRRHDEYTGKVTFSNCHIQYDYLLPGGEFISQYVEYISKSDVLFGNQLYQGIMPIKHLGERVYECRVDNILTVQIGEVT